VGLEVVMKTQKVWLVCGAALLVCCARPYQGADRADLGFFVFQSAGPMASVDVEILDAAEASAIASAITDETPERTDCGYSGTLSLQKDDHTVFDEPAKINLHPDCAHIVFTIEGKTRSRVLAGEGLTSLRTLYAEHVPAGKRVAY
jgi:hypothetical protein